MTTIADIDLARLGEHVRDGYEALTPEQRGVVDNVGVLQQLEFLSDRVRVLWTFPGEVDELCVADVALADVRWRTLGDA